MLYFKAKKSNFWAEYLILQELAPTANQWDETLLWEQLQAEQNRNDEDGYTYHYSPKGPERVITRLQPLYLFYFLNTFVPGKCKK